MYCLLPPYTVVQICYTPTPIYVLYITKSVLKYYTELLYLSVKKNMNFLGLPKSVCERKDLGLLGHGFFNLICELQYIHTEHIYDIITFFLSISQFFPRLAGTEKCTNHLNIYSICDYIPFKIKTVNHCETCVLASSAVREICHIRNKKRRNFGNRDMQSYTYILLSK